MVFIYVGISRFFGSASAQCMALSVSSPLFLEGFSRLCQVLANRKCEVLRLA